MVAVGAEGEPNYVTVSPEGRAVLFEFEGRGRPGTAAYVVVAVVLLIVAVVASWQYFRRGDAAAPAEGDDPEWLRRYALAFWLALPRFRPDYVHALVDGRKEVAGTAIAAIIANGQFFGGGMNIAPRSSVGDGIVDLQVFSGPRRKALTVMPRVVRGMHLRHKNVRRVTGRTIDVEVPESWPIEADGELLGVGPISVSVRPEAIDFKI